MPNALSERAFPPPPDTAARNNNTRPAPNALSALTNPMRGAAPAPNALAAAGNQIVPKMPAPTHAQTVAALRHFAMIDRQLQTLLNNPDLGKTDIRKAVIDAVTKLVGDRIISPTQAVQQMSSFPDKPFEQRQWLINMSAHNAAAEVMVLAHHGHAFAGQPAQPVPQNLEDNHMDTMAGMMADHYPGNNNA